MINENMLLFFRKIKRESYTDKARILEQQDAPNRYGYGNAYVAGAEFPCKFVPHNTPDALAGANVVVVDADLFFSNAAGIGPDDRIEITHLVGEALAQPQTFRIVSGPLQVSLGKQCGLELVTE